jgi:hypothetical protein
MYKRIYHNLPYLLKSKGTVAGLQNIISMFGITSSILSVKEFGGEWNSTKPVTGIKDIINDNIQILTSTQMSQSFFPIIPPDAIGNNYVSTPKFVLSSQKSILNNYNDGYFPFQTRRSLSPSVNTVEITFSPQNDIDNFIKSPGNLPNFDIGTYIGDPSQTFLPYYPDLVDEATSLLVDNDLNPIRYIRLIKYFDNSLFNMIKDFIPARTNLKSGITIKPHLLERNKIVQLTGNGPLTKNDLPENFTSEIVSLANALKLDKNGLPSRIDNLLLNKNIAFKDGQWTLPNK